MLEREIYKGNFYRFGLGDFEKMIRDIFKNFKKLGSIGAFIGKIKALEDWEIMLEIAKVFWDLFNKGFNCEKCSL